LGGSKRGQASIQPSGTCTPDGPSRYFFSKDRGAGGGPAGAQVKENNQTRGDGQFGREGKPDSDLRGRTGDLATAAPEDGAWGTKRGPDPGGWVSAAG